MIGTSDADNEKTISRGSVIPFTRYHSYAWCGALPIVALIILGVGLAGPMLGMPEAECETLSRYSALGLAASIILAVWYVRRIKVRYRIARCRTGETFLEVACRPRPIRITFPLRYDYAYFWEKVPSPRFSISHLVLTFRILGDAGEDVVTFREDRGALNRPPQGWRYSSGQFLNPSITFFGTRFGGGVNVEKLKQQIDELNERLA